MLCVLLLRSTGLPVCERQPLWEGSERSKLLILSPPNGFLLRSLFHNPPHSCGERMFFDCSHDFSRQTGFSPFCAALWECAAYRCMPKGDGEGGKRGTGGENPEGEGGLQPGCPPFPGLSPQDTGRTVLRRSSTQMMRKQKKKMVTQNIKVCLARRLSKTSHKQMVTKVNPYCLNGARRE